MTDDSRTLENPGCLALCVSAGLAALLLTLTPTIFPPGFASPLLYVPIFGVTAFIGAVIGLPLYLVARHFRCENVWTAIAAGAVTGAVLPLLSALKHEPSAWLAVAGYAAAGAVGGLAFFLTATASRAPRRNAALLLALACVSVAAALWAAPLAVARLSPPAPSSAAR